MLTIQLVTKCHQLKMSERMTDMNTEQLQLFEEQTIRTAWDEEKEEWYFSIVDVVGTLTESVDATQIALALSFNRCLPLPS